MPVSNKSRRLTFRTSGGITAIAAIASIAAAATLATVPALAESRVERGEQTGGRIPEEYLNQIQAAEPDAAASRSLGKNRVNAAKLLSNKAGAPKATGKYFVTPENR